MYFFSKQEWSKKFINKGLHKFFYLRWLELFDDKTYISWQLRTSDVFSVIAEMEDSICIIKFFPNHHHNILLLVNELINLIETNFLLKKDFSEGLFLAKKLKEIYNSNIKNIDKQNTIIFEAYLNKLKCVFISLKDYYINKLRYLLQNGTNEKKELDLVVSNLVTLLKNEGYSYFYLKNLINVFSQNKKEIEKITEFISLITKDIVSYQCHYLVKINDTYIKSLQDLGFIDIKKQEEYIFTSDKSTSFLEQDTKGVIILYQIQALDEYSALEKSIIEINKLKNKTEFIKSKSIINIIHKKIFLIEENSNKEFLLEKSCFQFYKINAPKNIFSSLEKLFKLDNVKNKNCNLYNSSINYYFLSKKTDESSLCFLNLWIALETIFQENDGNSIIGRIKDNLPEIVASFYIKDLLRELSKDIVRCLELYDFTDFNSLFPNSTKKNISSKDLILILTDEKNGNKIKKLLAFASQNELFGFRINEMWEKFFKDKTILKKRIELHINNMRWQVSRLYRIRNKIMHQGVDGIELSHYTHHLNHYYLDVFYRVLNTIIKNKNCSITNSIVIIKTNMEFFLKKLNDKEKIFYNEIYNLDFSEECQVEIWGKLN